MSRKGDTRIPDFEFYLDESSFCSVDAILWLLACCYRFRGNFLTCTFGFRSFGTWSLGLGIYGLVFRRYGFSRISSACSLDPLTVIALMLLFMRTRVVSVRATMCNDDRSQDVVGMK